MKTFVKSLAILSAVLVGLSACKKEDPQNPPMGIPTEFYISGNLQGKQVEAKTDSPSNISANAGLTCLITLDDPQEYALIGIGSTVFYSAADILALKGKSLNYGMGRDQALFVWLENGGMLSSNFTAQDGNSSFKITDVVEVGTNATGEKTFALRGTFQCKVKDNVNAVTTNMLSGNFTILVAENSI